MLSKLHSSMIVVSLPIKPFLPVQVLNPLKITHYHVLTIYRLWMGVLDMGPFGNGKDVARHLHFNAV
jgi:hypothetical protein